MSDTNAVETVAAAQKEQPLKRKRGGVIEVPIVDENEYRWLDIPVDGYTFGGGVRLLMLVTRNLEDVRDSCDIVTMSAPEHRLAATRPESVRLNDKMRELLANGTVQYAIQLRNRIIVAMRDNWPHVAGTHLAQNWPYMGASASAIERDIPERLRHRCFLSPSAWLMHCLAERWVARRMQGDAPLITAEQHAEVLLRPLVDNKPATKLKSKAQIGRELKIPAPGRTSAADSTFAITPLDNPLDPRTFVHFHKMPQLSSKRPEPLSEACQPRAQVRTADDSLILPPPPPLRLISTTPHLPLSSTLRPPPRSRSQTIAKKRPAAPSTAASADTTATPSARKRRVRFSESTKSGDANPRSEKKEWAAPLPPLLPPTPSISSASSQLTADNSVIFVGHIAADDREHWLQNRSILRRTIDRVLALTSGTDKEMALYLSNMLVRADYATKVRAANLTSSAFATFVMSHVNVANPNAYYLYTQRFTDLRPGEQMPFLFLRTYLEMCQRDRETSTPSLKGVAGPLADDLKDIVARAFQSQAVATRPPVATSTLAAATTPDSKQKAFQEAEEHRSDDGDIDDADASIEPNF